MARHEGGGGKVEPKRSRQVRNQEMGLDYPPSLDLNSASARDLTSHPAITDSLARKIVNLRKEGPIRGPDDLRINGLIDRARLARLASTYGFQVTRPVIVSIEPTIDRVYDKEPFGIRIEFAPGSLVEPEILSTEVRFPSGKIRHRHDLLTSEQQRDGSFTIEGLQSSESGELLVRVMLRDAAGGVHEAAALIGVFTRNPVRMYLTPNFWTQSSTVGAPRYDFGDDRFYCEADVRWVNSEPRSVNLGRRVTVRISDAGVGQIDQFSFNLGSDIVIPANSTTYGSLFTWHGKGSAAYEVYIGRGDLTYEYEMSGSGFTPTRHQIWRAMRVIGYNIIRVGDFTATERSEYRRAARDVASGIYRSRDMTVHGVELYRIEGTDEMDADKDRWRFIDNADERSAMRRKYRVDNWFLDVFFVEGIWSGAFGSSPVDGPVDKTGDSSGLVIRRDDDTINLGQTFAHEGGHYLGLEHADDDDGCDDTDPTAADIDDNFIFSSSRRDSDEITGCQINTMRQHGLVRVLTP